MKRELEHTKHYITKLGPITKSHTKGNNNRITPSEQTSVTAVPTKSDSDIIFCLQLLRKTLTYIYILSVVA